MLVELDLTERPSYNREKLLAYDTFVCGWCLEHPRYSTVETRSVVVFVCREERSLLGCAKVADEALTGRIGIMGAPADQWYYTGREHLFLARETDIHSGRLDAFALPALAPLVRERLTGDRDLALRQCPCCPRRWWTRQAGDSGHVIALPRCRHQNTSRLDTWFPAAELVPSADGQGPLRG